MNFILEILISEVIPMFHRYYIVQLIIIPYELLNALLEHVHVLVKDERLILSCDCCEDAGSFW